MRQFEVRVSEAGVSPWAIQRAILEVVEAGSSGHCVAREYRDAQDESGAWFTVSVVRHHRLGVVVSVWVPETEGEAAVRAEMDAAAVGDVTDPLPVPSVVERLASLAAARWRRAWDEVEHAAVFGVPAGGVVAFVRAQLRAQRWAQQLATWTVLRDHQRAMAAAGSVG